MSSTGLSRTHRRSLCGLLSFAAVGCASLLCCSLALAQHPSVVRSGGLVVIHGTDGDDFIRLGRVGNDMIVVSGPGVGREELSRVPLNQVSRVRFHGNRGNDHFSFLPGFSPSEGYQPDHPVLELFGGEGDDFLLGGSKSDLLVGGPGRDTLKGEHGNDIIFGGEGGDWLVGGPGNDFLCGGPGADRLEGNAGDDWLFSGPNDGTTTQLSGGPGTNFIAREACSGAPRELVGDWDGDGVLDTGYYLPERSLFLMPGGVVQVVPFGLPGDTPIVGNWLGNGYSRPGVYRNGLFYLDVGANYGWGPDGPAELGIPFGLPGDEPVVGDWENLGYDRVGVYRNGQWYLDVGDDGWNAEGPWEWPGVQFGGFPGDIPIVGDWDGDGRSDVGVFRHGQWFLDEGPRGWGPDTAQELTGIPFNGYSDPEVSFGPSWLFGH